MGYENFHFRFRTHLTIETRSDHSLQKLIVNYTVNDLHCAWWAWSSCPVCMSWFWCHQFSSFDVLSFVF